jgi:hypothetical protein
MKSLSVIVILAVLSKLIVCEHSVPFCSVPNLGIGLFQSTRNSGERSTFFREIAKTDPSLFRRIFPERNFNDNHTPF